MASGRRQPIRLALVAIGVGYGWWVAGLRPFSTSATVAVVGAGAAVVLLAATLRPLPTAPVGEERLGRSTTLVWSSLLVALAGWQLAAWVQSPRRDHPTLSSLSNALLEPRPLRALAIALWLTGAAWLGRR